MSAAASQRDFGMSRRQLFDQTTSRLQLRGRGNDRFWHDSAIRGAGEDGTNARCGSKTFDEIVSERLSRRGVLKGALVLGASTVSFLGGGNASRARAGSALLGFASIPTSKADTALGRMAHENAALSIAPDRRVVYYMGDDDFRSRFEHIYEFVSARPYVPGGGFE
jgi:secreted PhoX family phosphatase